MTFIITPSFYKTFLSPSYHFRFSLRRSRLIRRHVESRRVSRAIFQQPEKARRVAWHSSDRQPSTTPAEDAEASVLACARRCRFSFRSLRALRGQMKVYSDIEHNDDFDDFESLTFRHFHAKRIYDILSFFIIRRCDFHEDRRRAKRSRRLIFPVILALVEEDYCRFLALT